MVGASTLTFSWMHDAHTFPSVVSITASRWVSLLSTDTTRHLSTSWVSNGKGRWKTTETDLLTP
jgi:hypothetical protein